ncbi:G5 and 3D domain-containing protein [Fervidibacillus halotolerans]|uniref:Ubiquitin-like domain-containing protein n=1 Tax=Fervidibacillus halotolerans TaxID=2980027 RepID=A0A9E8S074_9BACI|nr:G5 and 3D domain-containing protein [Fervidibacillus halotolerans]WAA12332.1 ubiquitin-like domain-containing protein [Fervidibacillus halotolerans]
MNLKSMKSLLGNIRLDQKGKILLSASLLIFFSITGFFIYEVTKSTVNLHLNGEEKVVKTHAGQVKDLLEENEVQYQPHDYISPALDEKITDGMTVVWKPAKKVILEIDGVTEEIWTTEETVKDFLEKENIVINEHDVLHVSLDDKIKNNMHIKLDVGFQIVLDDGGKEKKYWTTSTTVGDFLKQQEIELNELDRIEPSLETKLNKESSIVITRVEKVTDVVEEPIDYAVVTKKDSSLLSGSEKVIQQGKEGKRQKEYEVIYENGEEVSRELISEDVIEEAVDKIVAVGTKKITTTASRGKAKGKEFIVRSTAYTASCNGCSGITATGIDLRANPNMKVIAVDPSVIPLGTKVYVEGYGYAIAADTGGGIKGYEIDVFFASKSNAYRWGIRNVKVKILN